MREHFDPAGSLRMSASISDSRAYFAAVQDYFLERTGRGLVLSSRDLELLMEWLDSGASAAIVCQAIDDAIDRLEKLPRDIYSCRKYMESRLSQLPTRSLRAPQPVRRAPQPSMDETPSLLQKLQAARESARRLEFRDVYARLYPMIAEAIAGGADPLVVAYQYDDQLVDEAFAALGSDERRKIDLEIEGRFGAHLAMMPPEGREDTLRASRRDILQTRFGLIPLVE